MPLWTCDGTCYCVVVLFCCLDVTTHAYILLSFGATAGSVCTWVWLVSFLCSTSSFTPSMFSQNGSVADIAKWRIQKVCRI